MDQSENQKKSLALPSSQTVEKELARIRKNKIFMRSLRATLGMLITIAAAAVLLSNYFFPVFRIYGDSMEPVLTEGEIAVAIKQSDLEKGDIIAFYYNNKILIKRIIAEPGDIIDIDSEGKVTINGEYVDESYLQDQSFGNSDLDYPYQVPEKRWFVMGDARSISLDSRMKSIGTIAQEQIIGKLVWKVWPLDESGAIE